MINNFSFSKIQFSHEYFNNELISINCTFEIILNPLLPFINYLVDLSRIKFSWFQAQQVFHKLVNLIFLRKSFVIHFVENEKDGNYLVQDLVMNNGGWGRTDQSKSNIFFCVILAKCGLALSSRSTMFLFLTSVGLYFSSLFLSFSNGSGLECDEVKCKLSSMFAWITFQ